MANLKLRYCIVIILLAVTASVVSALQYDASGDEIAGFADLQKIPMQIGNWKGRDLPLNESVYEILETRAIIHRNYTDDKGNTILLSIVYYHDTKVDFHAPESCLGGKGERTTKRIVKLFLPINKEIISLEVAKIIASNADDQSVSYYFYKAGDFIGQNYFKMRLTLAENSLIRNDKSGSLVRITSNSTFGQIKKKEAINIKFLTAIFPFLVKKVTQGE